MGFLKKNLIFSVVVFVCLLAFAAGAYFAFTESGKISQAEQKISRAESQLNNALNTDPAPTTENIQASAENVRELTAELESIRTNLEQGSRLQTSSDGIQVMAAIQQFISDYQRKAQENTREEDKAAPIQLPDDFAFGFEQYIDEAKIPEDADVIPVMDKQRQILEYLLNKLFSANPHSIEAVKREVLENKSESEAGQGFQVDPAISARVPGAIETLGFSLTFTGYTDSLREFLNTLTHFDLPIVVRSVEVERAEARAASQRPTRNTNNLDAIFGVFGGEAESNEAEAPQEVQKPVIAENVSSFTVVVEFIEIILPEESDAENL